jgi:CBS domain-containing protein
MSLSEFDDAYEDGFNVRDGVADAILETSVGEIMVADPLVVDAESTVVAAVRAMNEHRVGCVLVRKDGKLAGIFTERDVLRKVIFHEGSGDWKVEAVMTPNPETLPPEASVAYALNKMSVDGFRHVPIVDQEGKAIGVLSVKDIVNLVVEWSPGSVFNLPAHPDDAIPKTDGGA